MIVRITRVKVGNRQAPQQCQKPHPTKVGFLRLHGCKGRNLATGKLANAAPNAGAQNRTPAVDPQPFQKDPPVRIAPTRGPFQSTSGRQALLRIGS
jgi:hypothetical protein